MMVGIRLERSFCDGTLRHLQILLLGAMEDIYSVEPVYLDGDFKPCLPISH